MKSKTTSKSFKETGSVRVDLLGGTIDLYPISLILSNVVTINLATSLKVEVKLSACKHKSEDAVTLISKDYDHQLMLTKSLWNRSLFYEEEEGDRFGKLKFLVEIIKTFPFEKIKNCKIEVKSAIPAGTGLGGSSAMGATLYRALAKYCGKAIKSDSEIAKAVEVVKALESRILVAGPAGYQDYYPALYGGVLSLIPLPGSVKVVQAYSPKLKQFLEEHITLVYSGISRNSGINNWEVYKSFFDKREESDKSASIRMRLQAIANCSYEGFNAIKEGRYHDLLLAIAEEGELRKGAASGIVIKEMAELYSELRTEFGSDKILGMKVCGAGGGGCFLLLHERGVQKGLLETIKRHRMQRLDFKIALPLL
ncbi:MAG: hypothetical protein HQK50_11800 [Oligoflexia bacterium]|nr:hypothetical protein [Oligoflexia bacterium]MBF0366247.1 hypothetical protein [Oligoflexia bacterium]